MLRWTLRSLLMESTALVAGIVAAASALLLLLFYEAVWAGEADKVVAYPRNAEADVWVMQRGVSNMHMATSYLADWKVTRVGQVPGVAGVEAILYLNTVVEAGGRQWFAYVVGVDTPAERAGPWAMRAGKRQPEPGEAIVPGVFADISELELGGTLRIVDQRFGIVGLSEGTFSMANSVIFVNRRDLEDIMSSLDIVSYMLVTAEQGTTSEALADRIQQDVEDVDALPAETFLRNDRQLAVQMGVETIAMMTFICGVLAVLIVAFTVYSQVSRQSRELAVLKALGASNRSLYASIGLQAGVLALGSATVAAMLAWLLTPLASRLIPMFSLQLTAESVLRTAAAGLIVAIVASVVPAGRIARLDPMTAFQR